MQRSASLGRAVRGAAVAAAAKPPASALAREILARYARADHRPAHRLLRGAGDPFRPRPRPHRGRDGRMAASPSTPRRRRGPSSRPSRAGRNCSAGSIWRRAAPRRWCACASSCSTPWSHRDDLAAVDADFVHLFSSWFNRGFLVLRRIDWSTPANILEKIIRYEAVHEIGDWDDLRRAHRSAGPALLRLLPSGAGRRAADLRRGGADPRDRRRRSRRSCRDGRERLEPDKAHHGDLLLDLQLPARARRRVVRQLPDQAGGRGDLARAAARSTTFVTLSPVPDFAGWLKRERRREASARLERRGSRSARRARSTRTGRRSPRHAPTSCSEPLLRAAAYYYLRGRNRPRRAGRSGRALPSRQRRAARADQLAGRHLAKGAQAVATA